MIWQPPSGGNGGNSYRPPMFGTRNAANCCAPVEIITTTGLVLATVASGGTYTPNYFRLDVTALANGSNVVSAIVKTSSQFDELVSSRINTTSTVFRKNSVVQTLPFYAVENDTIEVTITPTNGAIDAEAVVIGTFLSDQQTAIAPYMGGDGRYVYFLNEVSKDVTVIDSTTKLTVATIALDAGSLHTSIRYRAIDNSVWVWGFSGLNDFTLQKIDTATGIAGAMTSYVAALIGATAVCVGYDYKHDRFILVGGAGPSSPIVVFEAATMTFTSTPIFDLPGTVSSVDYMGYASLLEDAFFICGNANPSIAYAEDGSGFISKDVILRAGSAQVCYNRNNGTYVVSDNSGGARTYNPRKKPAPTFVGGVNFRRAGIAHDYVNDTMIGCDNASRSYGIYDIGAGTITGFTLAAVGAETNYRSAIYNEFSGEFYINTGGGSTGRVINTTTGAVIATLVLGTQKASNAGSLNQICTNRLSLY